jgi:hypothetical protein
MFWDSQAFFLSLQPNWKKWQKVWEIRIKYYTPRTNTQQPDVDVACIIEKFNPKKKLGESQISTIGVSPMFCLEIIDLYRQCNEPSSAVIKTADASDHATESLRKLIALEHLNS